MGRSVRKSLRLETKPRDRGFCEPPSRGAVFPSGKVTLGGGVLGLLHFGAIVLNALLASSLRNNCPSLFDSITARMDAQRGRAG